MRSQQNTITNEYAGQRYDLLKRERLGMRVHESVDLLTETAVRTFYHQEENLRGNVELEEVFKDSGAEDELLRYVHNLYTPVEACSNSDPCAIGDPGNHAGRIPGSYALEAMVTTEKTYDPGPGAGNEGTIVQGKSVLMNPTFGYVESVQDFGVDGIEDSVDDVAIVTEVAPNTTDWIVQSPYRITTQSNADASILSVEEFLYDGVSIASINTPPTKGLVTEYRKWMDAAGTQVQSTRQTYDDFGNVKEFFDASNETTDKPNKAISYETDNQTFVSQIDTRIGPDSSDIASTKYGFDKGFGELAKVMTSDGHLYCVDFDEFGRIDTTRDLGTALDPSSDITSIDCGLDANSILMEFAYSDPGTSTPATQYYEAKKYLEEDPGGGNREFDLTRAYYDGLGRDYLDIKKRGSAFEYVITAKDYDDAGQVVCESAPRDSGFDKAAPLPASIDTSSLTCDGGLHYVSLYDAYQRLQVRSRKAGAGAQEVPLNDYSYFMADRDGVAGMEQVVRTVTFGDGTSQSPNRSVDVGKNAKGQVVAVEEWDGTTILERDLKGQVTRVDAPNVPTAAGSDLNLMDIEYNLLGQRTLVRRPDSSGIGPDWTYQYNEKGELTVKTSPRGFGRLILYYYDSIGRICLKDTFPWFDPAVGDTCGDVLPDVFLSSLDGSDAMYFYYGNESYPGIHQNGAGQIARINTPAIIKSYVYDFRGNVEIETLEIAGRSYQFVNDHSRYQKLVSTAYPDGEILALSYAGGDALTGITSDQHGTYLSNVRFNPDGQLAEYTLMDDLGDPANDGVDFSFAYDPNTYFLQNFTASSSAEPALQNLYYTYDVAGNPLQIDDSVVRPGANTNMTQTHDYDPLHRLVSTELDSISTNALTFDYDAAGNIIGHAAANASSQAMEWQDFNLGIASGDNSTVNAVLDLEETGTPATYNYDLDGNLISRISRSSSDEDDTLAWNSDGRLVFYESTDGSLAGYKYDERGMRTEKVAVDKNILSMVKLFVRPDYEVDLYNGKFKQQFKVSALGGFEIEHIGSGDTPNSELLICLNGFGVGNSLIDTCAQCDNGVADNGEQCDGSDLDGQVCADFAAMGLTGGILGCNNQCQFDFSGCTGGGGGGC